MPDNGKLTLKNPEAKIIVDEETKKALTREETLEEINEPTKYILMNDAFVKSVATEVARHFTQYKDKDEILLMNDITNHARLIPVVFKSKDENVNKRIKDTAELFTKHEYDHNDHSMSLKGFTAKLFAMVLRQDNGQMPTDKDIKKMFGR